MAGRPSKYKPEYADQAYKLCLLGATDKDMASFFEVNEDTINEWKNKHTDFSESIKRGKQIADATVAEKLYHRAIGYSHPEIITASHQGQITDTMEVIKHYAPDPTAAIFWLKNRQPQKWRDKQDIEHSGTMTTEVKHDLRKLSAKELADLEHILTKTADTG